jgi:hypothetical protein
VTLPVVARPLSDQLVAAAAGEMHAAVAASAHRMRFVMPIEIPRFNMSSHDKPHAKLGRVFHDSKVGLTVPEICEAEFKVDGGN